VLSYTLESKVRPLHQGYVIVTILHQWYVIGYPGFGCPEVVFLILSFHFINENSCVIYFPHYFVNTLRTHTLAFTLEVNFIFQLVSELGTLC
jgi:hypothetical protein